MLFFVVIGATETSASDECETSREACRRIQHYGGGGGGGGGGEKPGEIRVTGSS
jgi:hypothetical protein